MRSDPDFDRAPHAAIWELTRACDQGCRHCRAGAQPSRHPSELSTAEALDLVDQVHALGPAVLVLTGGDPLKRPDLFPIAAAAVARQLTVEVAASVTPLLTGEAIEDLAASGVRRLALGLDGPDAGTHDGLRGVAGSYAATRDAIAAVRNAGLSLQINTTLTRRTVRELPRTGRLVARLAPDLWNVVFALPRGPGVPDHSPDAATCEAAFHYLYDWGVTHDLAVTTTAAPAFQRVVTERDVERRRSGRTGRPAARPVGDGKGLVFVTHTGDVCPSPSLPLKVDSVRTRPLADIYRRNPFLQALRLDALLEGRCGRCPFRTVCGGSRGRAYASSGNLFAEDPGCTYVPAAVDRSFVPAPPAREGMGEPDACIASSISN